MKKNIVLRGWRNFLCNECGTEWEEATRDHRSPSGENCPKCGGWEFPRSSYEDVSLKIDKANNLLMPHGERIVVFPEKP